MVARQQERDSRTIRARQGSFLAPFGAFPAQIKVGKGPAELGKVGDGDGWSEMGLIGGESR